MALAFGHGLEVGDPVLRRAVRRVAGERKMTVPIVLDSGIDYLLISRRGELLAMAPFGAGVD